MLAFIFFIAFPGIVCFYYIQMPASSLQLAIQAVPTGRWAVGVSGGADSVALLILLAERSDLSLHIVHLDHETREGESAIDARFVSDLAMSLGLPCTIECRTVVESNFAKLAPNLSARYRLARLELFQKVVKLQNLNGVILAHHADDQAETILMRLLRGAGAQNLGGIRVDAVVSGLRILRPLLTTRSVDLREYLRQRGQSWRDDSSNRSTRYQRNRLRQCLSSQLGLSQELIRLGHDSDALRRWLDEHAPVLQSSFATGTLSNLPRPLTRHAAARWLVEQGSPPTKINSRTCDRLIEMAIDAGTAPRQHFPADYWFNGGRVKYLSIHSPRISGRRFRLDMLFFRK